MPEQPLELERAASELWAPEPAALDSPCSDRVRAEPLALELARQAQGTERALSAQAPGQRVQETEPPRSQERKERRFS